MLAEIDEIEQGCHSNASGGTEKAEEIQPYTVVLGLKAQGSRLKAKGGKHMKNLKSVALMFGELC